MSRSGQGTPTSARLLFRLALKPDDIDIAGDMMFWGEEGYLSYFEMYSFGDFFNEEVRAFRLAAFEE